MHKQYIEYRDREETLLEAFVAYDDKTHDRRPGVLIVHDWSGRNDFAMNKAEKIAELGYVGFALDMYGKGKLGKTNEEKSALIQPLMDDRTLLLDRLEAAQDALCHIDIVDKTRIAIMGFCFGGLCALDLARSGADIRGAVAFHALFKQPGGIERETIKAKVLALHGYDDPMVTPQDVLDFAKEMTDYKADWQIHMYGHTMHAFTNPIANDPEFGTVYDAKADKRSWQAMKDFFAEIFNRD